MALRCLQLSLNFMNGLLVLAGIFIIISSSKLYNSEFIEDLVKAADLSFDLQRIFSGSLFLFGVGVILLGFLGVLSGWSQNKCLFCIYLFAIFLLTLLILSVSIAFTYIYIYQKNNYTSEKICNNESELSNFLIEADDAAKLANKGICSLICPCNMNEDIAKQFQNNSNFILNEDGAISTTTCNPCLSPDPKIQNLLMELRANHTIGPNDCPS